MDHKQQQFPLFQSSAKKCRNCKSIILLLPEGALTPNEQMGECRLLGQIHSYQSCLRVQTTLRSGIVKGIKCLQNGVHETHSSSQDMFIYTYVHGQSFNIIDISIFILFWSLVQQIFQVWWPKNMVHPSSILKKFEQDWSSWDIAIYLYIAMGWPRSGRYCFGMLAYCTVRNKGSTVRWNAKTADCVK